MSGLDVKGFDLFSKKSAPIKQTPIAVPVTSPKVVAEEVKKFDAEVMEEVLEAAPAVNSVIEEKSMSAPSKSIEVTSRPPERTREESSLRKFETFATPTFRIPEEHDQELKKIETFIMRNRKKGANSDNRERITTNTVVRALIANFLERAGDMDLSNIDNEEMLRERMERVFKQKYSKRT